MRIFDNGIYRDMTEEEIEAASAGSAFPGSPDEKVDKAELANIIFGGDDE